jgi:hypothetical protein
MTRLYNCGIYIDIPEAEIESYLRAGYVKINEPVEIPAPEFDQESSPEKAAKPDEVMEPVKKVKKVVKHGD